MHGDFFINEWLIQPQINTVEKSGRVWHLEPKVMQVLVFLSSHPNQVLSKEKLIETVWRGTFVGDDVLVRCISEIRYVFGDDPRSPSVIQTIPKAGYRLIASVKKETAPETSQTEVRPSAVLNAENADGIAGGVDGKAVALADSGPPVADAAARDIEPSRTAERAPLFRRHPLLFWVVAVLLVAAAAALYWRASRPTPFEVFWAPVLNTREPALLCIADQNQYSFVTLRDAADPTHQVILKDNLSAVVMDDLDTIVRVAGTLRAHGKEYQMKGQEAATLSDLQNGPSIFIGAFDNTWTLRLTKKLRYHFANNPDMTRFEIVDGPNQAPTPWVVDRNQQLATNNYQDYAIIARFRDDITGKPAVIVAGIARGGTIAAGEFLTSSDELAQLMPQIKAAGSKKNIEIILSTQIIDGHPGSPKVEAVHFW